MKRQPTSGRPSEALSEVEMVITAPEPYAASLALRGRARMTLGALTQLIANAERYVTLSVPYIQEGDSVAVPIYLALQSALKRGVDVDIVSTLEGLRVFNKKNLGSGTKGRLRFFRPRANVEDERRLGSHAKLCLCDGAHAYVGSANLTVPGLAENLEMGLLVHGQIAQQITEFWRFLLEEKFFVEATPEYSEERGHSASQNAGS